MEGEDDPLVVVVGGGGVGVVVPDTLPLDVAVGVGVVAPETLAVDRDACAARIVK